MSITRRLMWSLTGATVLFWLVACGLSAFVMREEFDEMFDSALEETAQRLLPLTVNELFQREDPSTAGRVDGGGGEEYLTYQLRDAKGAVVMHSHDAQTQPFDAPLASGYSDTARYRIFTQPAVSGTLFLQVADRFDHRREAVIEAVTSLLLPLALVAPLSMIAIWTLVRRSLSPLRALRAQIGARDGVNLQPMTVAALPAELAAIAGSVNRLLDRLRTALDAEREFAANSAHELRTPVAGALVQTQRLVAELPPGPARDRASRIEASLTSLGRLTEKLLQLARADSGLGASASEADIVAVVRLVAEEFARKTDHAQRIRLDAGKSAASRRRIDVDALGIVLRNLIENALLHGARDAPVTIIVDGAGTVTIGNAGAIVPEAQMRDLKLRFKRGGSPEPGSGLGLSIAEALARQMGAALTFASPATGRHDGFEVRLSWRDEIA